MNTFQKLSVAASTAILTLSVSTGSALAGSLIGQTIEVNNVFPSINNNVQSFTTTVTADSSDAINILYVLVDPNAQGFSIDFSAWGDVSYSNTPFNGIKVSNLNFGDGSFITDFSITTSGAFVGFDPSRISFIKDAVFVNFSNLSISNPTFNTHSILNVSLQTSQPVVPVPVPGAVFGIVLAGSALMARQSKKAKTEQTVA